LRKSVAVLAAVLVLTGSTAAKCGGPHDKCKPYGTRIDKENPHRYWVCNKDGTKEEPVDAPGPFPSQ
jgi:hypothetical protein